MAQIINGKMIAQELLSNLKQKVEGLKARYNITPTLAIILVGEDPASLIYVSNKIKAAQQIGIRAELIRFNEQVDIQTLLKQIDELNNNQIISGIIVQLPLPKNINKNLIIEAINPAKDVDGFHPINAGYLHNGLDQGFVPCTALGCLYLIKECCQDLKGKRAVIVGRSNIVGKPLAALLLKENCTITICHSHTQNLSAITKEADIVIAAIGIPLMFTKEYFNSNAIVIDVGINRIAAGSIAGDVNFEDVKEKVRYITPVPGGVGPMTIAFLLNNTFNAMQSQRKIRE